MPVVTSRTKLHQEDTPMPDPARLNDDFLDLTELAAWLQITVRHLRRRIAEGRIPKDKIGVWLGFVAPRFNTGSQPRGGGQ